VCCCTVVLSFRVFSTVVEGKREKGKKKIKQRCLLLSVRRSAS